MKRRTIRASALAAGLLLACGTMPPKSALGLMDPSNLGLPAAGAYGLTGIPANNASAMCVACHSATPVPDRTSHFVHRAGKETASADRSSKERTGAWTGSQWYSKYGDFVSSPPRSDNTAVGELICESCHSIARNVAGPYNLLESSRLTDLRPAQPNDLASATTTLCEGCHTAATLSPLSGILGHHPMGDGINLQNSDTLSDGTKLSTADTAFTRGFVDNSELGGAGSGVRYPRANGLSCLSCHGNGHGGHTKTGARILNRGYGRDPANPGAGVTGVDNTGVDRQVDAVSNGFDRLITNFTPMCDSCHKTND